MSDNSSERLNIKVLESLVNEVLSNMSPEAVAALVDEIMQKLEIEALSETSPRHPSLHAIKKVAGGSPCDFRE